MNEDHAKKTIAVCDTQPITAQGLRNLLAASEDLELVEAMNSLDAAAAYVHAKKPDIVVVDKGFGMRAVLDWIHDLKLTDHRKGWKSGGRLAGARSRLIIGKSLTG